MILIWSRIWFLLKVFYTFSINNCSLFKHFCYIVSYPYVYLHPSQLKVLENSTFTFRCSVSGMRKDENYSIVWMHGDGENLQNDVKF